jgi:hypothetical protein
VFWTASASSIESGLSTVKRASSTSPGESRTGDLLDAIAETQAPVKQTCCTSEAAPVVDRSAWVWVALAQVSDSAVPVAMSPIAACSRASGADAQDTVLEGAQYAVTASRS